MSSETLDRYRRRVVADPNDRDAANNLIRAYARLGKDELSKILRIEPYDIYAQTAMIHLYEDDPVEAIYMYPSIANNEALAAPILKKAWEGGYPPWDTVNPGSLLYKMEWMKEKAFRFGKHLINKAIIEPLDINKELVTSPAFDRWLSPEYPRDLFNFSMTSSRDIEFVKFFLSFEIPNDQLPTHSVNIAYHGAESMNRVTEELFSDFNNIPLWQWRGYYFRPTSLDTSIKFGMEKRVENFMLWEILVNY